jgi:hypothetical protein
MPRKTVNVAHVRERVNYLLANNETMTGRTEEEQRAYRLGACSVLELILHNTGNYKGFNYLESEILPPEERKDGNVLRAGYDDTRRVYY